MCGICGELRFDGLSPDKTTLANMTEQLARRGPDASGDYFSGPVAFGHRRLSVIDLSERSRQPMVDTALGLILVFNGTIYNYPELREQLRGKGYTFFSGGDSEVILKAYAEWGEDCPQHLQGVFAFAIWNTHTRQLFMARDRFGVKPFYYSINRHGVRFASTSQALLAGGEVNTAIDPVALHHHLTLHAVVPAPRTLLQGLRKLRPGHSLTFNLRGERRLRRYWQLDLTPPADDLSEWEWIEAIHVELRKAVARRRAIADVPVGILLSGGLDSSLLVALLAEAGGGDLLTFSVGFEDEPEEKGNEFDCSDLVADLYGTQHHRFIVPNDEVLARLPEAIDNMGQPMVAQDAVAFYLLGEQVSQQVKVVQSGQGADEVFGGYFWYQQMQAASGTDIERFRPLYFDRTDAEYRQTVTSGYHGLDYTTARVAHGLSQFQTNDFLNRVLAYDVTTLIVDDPVKRVDNMTMAWGLESRVPFLDQELVQLAARMPAALKIKSGGKHPLKMIARGLLPDKIIDRPKGYFPVPSLKFVRGQVLEFMRDVLESRACRERGLFQRTCVQALLENPDQAHTPLLGSKLWHLALLEFWLQRNVDKSL
ncbi:MAG: N-acetylglutaminylglutamine amidotransferase [Gammaproteobacteria bacterium]|nr:MAG: N-acetylglutaminylglutamine amidotransferase [Gammaproteobacteria bacterium]